MVTVCKVALLNTHQCIFRDRLWDSLETHRHTKSIVSISKMYLFNPRHRSRPINVSFETDPEPKNGLDPGSTKTVSRYSTTLTATRKSPRLNMVMVKEEKFQSMSWVPTSVLDRCVKSSSRCGSSKRDCSSARDGVLWALTASRVSSREFPHVIWLPVIGGGGQGELVICWNNNSSHWMEWFWKNGPIGRAVIPTTFFILFALITESSSHYLP